MTDSSGSLAEAAQWFAALHRNIMTLEERAAFELWCRSAENRAALARVERAWESVGRLEGGAPATAGVPSLGRRRFLTRAAVSALAASGMAGAAWYWRRPAWDGLIETGVGEQRALTLADGSVVRLNVKSRLRWRIGAASREVALLAGDALFSVAPDPARPFTVAYEGGSVRVLGTVFAVSLRDGGGDVGVREGKVTLNAARDPRGQVMLTAGQGVRFGRQGVESVRPIGPEQVGEWEDHFVTFDHASLADIAGELARYFPVAIQIEPEAARRRRITMRLKLQDEDSTLDLLGRMLGARLERPSPSVAVMRLSS